MSIERNRRLRRVVVGQAFDEDVEEEKVGFWGGEEELTRMVDGLEVRELVSEFGEGGEVVVQAVEDDLGVGLRELGERGGLVEDVQEEVAVARCTRSRGYVSANHYLCIKPRKLFDKISNVGDCYTTVTEFSYIKNWARKSLFP